jgi:hypothetical protein
MDALVIDLLDPRGEQPVHLGQAGHCPARFAVPAGDLDAEFLLDGAEEALDLAPALRLTGQSRLILWITVPG